MSVSKTILIGRLGKDPEIRTMQDGREIASFNLATSETWKDKNTGERKEKTEWHRIAIFNPGLVKIVKSYAKKGSKVYIEGCNQTEKWTKDGVDHQTTKVVLQGFNCALTLLDSRDKSESQDTYKPEYNQDISQEKPIEITVGFGNEEALNDEIPF